MNCDEVQQLLPSYVTGVLDADQASQVRAHLGTHCAGCVRALHETEAALELFTESLAPMTPPPQIKKKLMTAVHGHTISVRHTPRGRLLPYAMAACVGMLIGAGIIFVGFVNHGSDRTPQLLSALADRDARIDQLNNLLGASNLNLVELTSQKSQAHGHILYDPANHHWRIYVFNLEPPPINHVYELWAITADNKKLPAGTFTVNAEGSATYSGNVPDNVAAAAITDEPMPGTTTPTGSIHLLGKISG